MNTSGITPIGYNVLVKQDETSAQTKGGLYLPDAEVEREKFRGTRGEVMSCSPAAFEDFPKDMDRPVEGSRVIWARNAGVLIDGVDGGEYRLLDEKDILGLLDE